MSFLIQHFLQTKIHRFLLSYYLHVASFNFLGFLSLIISNPVNHQYIIGLFLQIASLLFVHTVKL